ncbi:hypothetical protein K523DRAFT_321557 [Schizophyllum commune Tattone D]|uniref:NADH dehydrogenase [ubiquinone] 1 alpha subcomplex subunit 13 n=1 Tax=Schizophyllum commune (strain H4-8 / FGSC 9210) TaxID=578458 RepID=D8PJT1_SCHCM|nr:uncharacterized protein SCHCODRAFT_02623331 [Schizophyllum commune H4-8]KAI5828213.1 hypothetical protein K523DRAFT_321557 [Schizophyllum commune Tattone D]KAI5893980.1 hypothetical protein SCHCODRAFT_02623331 [Schizophyllum commune H4-8]
MPPPGGFEAVKYKRNLPNRGLPAWAVMTGISILSAYGWYRIVQGNWEMREIVREKRWGRIHLVPLLMAEADRDAYRLQQAALAREKEAMKDVKGWEAGKSVYNNTKYQPNEIVIT